MNAMGVMAKAVEHGTVIVFKRSASNVGVVPYSESNWNQITNKGMPVIGVYDDTASLEDIESDLE